MPDRVSDLTIDEFKQLIRETVTEVFYELADDIDDEGNAQFQPAAAERLRAYLRDKPTGRTLDEVAREYRADH